MALKQPSRLNLQFQGDTFAAGLEEAHQTLREYLEGAHANQTKHAGYQEVIFEVADKIWLSTWYCRMTIPSKQLDYKPTALYIVSKVINKNDYTLDRPYMIQKYNVFHVSLLDCNKSPTTVLPSSELQPTAVDDSDEWEVNLTVDFKQCNQNLHHLFHWAAYSDIPCSWEADENLQKQQEVVDDFHHKIPRKPRWCFDLEVWDWT